MGLNNFYEGGVGALDRDLLRQLSQIIESSPNTVTKSQTLSQGQSFTFTPGGDLKPQNAKLILRGIKSVNSRTGVSLSNGNTITIGGNSSPENEQVTIKGSGSNSSQSTSFSDGTSISVDGNASPQDQQYTISASYNTYNDEIVNEGRVKETQSAQSHTFGVYGTIPPSDANVYVMDNWLDALVVNNGSVSGDLSSYPLTFNVDVPSGKSIDSVGLTFEQDSLYSQEDIDVFVDGNSYGTETLYGGGTDRWYGTATSNGTITIDVESSYKYDSYGVITDSNIYTNERPSFSDVSVTSPSPVSGSGPNWYVDISKPEATVDVSTSVGQIKYDLSYTRRNGVEDPSVTIDGETQTYNGTVNGQITENMNFGRGSHTVNFSYTGDSQFLDGTNLSWTEVNETQDPSVNIGGVDVSYSGFLGSGQSHTENISLSTGDNFISTSYSGPQPTYELSVDEVNNTKDPVAIGAGEALYQSGVLPDGSSVEIPLNLQLGQTYTVELLSGEFSAEAEVMWDEIVE